MNFAGPTHYCLSVEKTIRKQRVYPTAIVNYWVGVERKLHQEKMSNELCETVWAKAFGNPSNDKVLSHEDWGFGSSAMTNI